MGDAPFDGLVSSGHRVDATLITLVQIMIEFDSVQVQVCVCVCAGVLVCRRVCVCVF